MFSFVKKFSLDLFLRLQIDVSDYLDKRALFKKYHNRYNRVRPAIVATSLFLHGYVIEESVEFDLVMRGVDLNRDWSDVQHRYAKLVALHCLRIEDESVCQAYATLVAAKETSGYPLTLIREHVPMLAEAFGLSEEVGKSYAVLAENIFIKVFEEKRNCREAFHFTWGYIVGALKVDRRNSQLPA